MPSLAKVWFVLEEDAWHGSATETLWAEKVGEELYKLENTPFFAYGVNFEDVVQVKQENERSIFLKVARRSGRSTVRVMVMRGKSDAFAIWWNQLASLGCTFEENQNLALYAVDIPTGSDLRAIVDVLDAGVENGVWEWEEGSLIE